MVMVVWVVEVVVVIHVCIIIAKKRGGMHKDRSCVRAGACESYMWVPGH